MSTVTTKRTPPPGKDYGYGNARARGMRSHLLAPAFYEQMLDAPDLTKIIQLLHDTEYSEDVDAAIIRGRNSASIEEAFRENMVRTFQKVMGFLNAEAYGLVGTLLGRWDLFNVKSIIRGKHLRLQADEIEGGLYAVGGLTPVELHFLAVLDDIRAVIDTLWTWGSPYAEPLSSNWVAYRKDNNLTLLELSLDRYYSTWAIERMSRRGTNAALARRILGLQIDSINLLTTFRILKSDIGAIDPHDFFLEGGEYIHEDLFIQLSALSDVDEVLEKLQRTPYGPQLESVVVNYAEENSLSVFERALEDYVMRRAISAGRGDPLGVGVIISYLWAKQNEITNLRIIVRGNVVGMPADRVRKELILV